jgi:hypothetical protein
MFRRTQIVCLLSPLFLLSWIARADVLFLNHGGRVEGELLNPEQSPRQNYLVQTPDGVKLTVPAAQVDRVVVKSDAVRKYETLLAKLPDTPEAHLDFAERCGKANLNEQRQFHLEQVLRLDPNHEAARHQLGYSRVDGKWTKPSETMEAKGYIRAGGAWRLPQELELDAAADEHDQKVSRWRKDFKIWRDWIVKGRDPQKVIQGEQSYRAVHDPLAAEALAELLTREKEPPALRLLYVDVLGQINATASLVTLVRLAVEDRDPAIRERCLDKLAKAQSKAAVRQFMKGLKHEDNVIVNRAAVALDRMKDPEATPALIDALITTHKLVEGGGSGISPTFTPEGGGGLSMGGGQKVVKKQFKNETVLRTLTVLNPGVNLGFDQVSWKAWYASQNKPQTIVSLRRSE